jgi:CelD/BcsL family acetyltransferase involved in cellulose biosynthesis
MTQAPLVTKVRPSLCPADRPINGEATVTLSIHQKLAAIENDWREFEKHADCTVFQTFDFVSTYYRHIGAERHVQPAIVVGRSTVGKILFLIPLGIVKRGPFSLLTFLGSDVCDYNGPLLAVEFSAQVERQVFLRIWQEVTLRLTAEVGTAFDVIDLEKMPRHIGAQANPFIELGTDPHPSGAYKTHLDSDWNTFYLKKRSSWRRKRDRARERKLTDRGSIRYHIPEGCFGVSQTMALLFTQKMESFSAAGVSNLFERPGYRTFFQELATRSTPSAMVHISRLEVGDDTAAVNFGLLFRGRFYHLIASYDRIKFSRLGAGTMHLQYIMRDALERGCRTFDFTVGDEPYKREWCDTVTPLCDHISSVGWKAGALIILIRFTRRMKRRIKQTTWLWSTFLKIRASTAGFHR